MDQDQFRQTYHEYNQRNCVFEKSILTNECNCSQVERFCIAEREGAHCLRAEAREQCVRYLQQVREESRFALRTDQERGILPHGKAIRLQVGGLRGVLAALDPKNAPPGVIPDVHGALSSAARQFGAIDKLPFVTIMKYISAYRSKIRSRRKRR